jgi:hypothetical protein
VARDRAAGEVTSVSLPVHLASTLAKPLHPPSPGNHAMTKEIRLNAFDMNCVGHSQREMWTHPRDRSVAYNTIEYWQDLARLAERGKFDGIFRPTLSASTTSTGGGPAPSIVNAVQIPVNDPMMVLPVLSHNRTEGRPRPVAANRVRVIARRLDLDEA